MSNYSERINAALGVALRRQYNTPLDVSSVFKSLADFEAYITQNTAYENPAYEEKENTFLQKINLWSYPGQVVAVIEGDRARAYVINKVGPLETLENGSTEKIASRYQEVGAEVKVDGKTITITNGVLKIGGISDIPAERTKAYQPTLDTNGNIVWSPVSETTIEGLNSIVSGIQTRVATLEGTVGDADKGLVKDVADLKTLTSTQGQSITTLQTDLDKAEENIGKLQSSMGQVTTGVASLKTRMTTAEGEIDAIQQKDIDQDGRLSDLETNVGVPKKGDAAATGVFATIAGIESELDAAQQDILDIESAYLKSVAYDSTSGVFTFVKQDGNEVKVDLAVEKVVTNFTYDETNKELVLTHADGTTQKVPMSAFIDDYSGSTGSEIKVEIDNSNVVSASVVEISGSKLADASVAEAKLDATLQTKLAGIGTNAENITKNANAIKALQETDTKHEQRLDALEGAVGDSEDGLVKDVADLKTTVGDSTSGLVKDTADLKTTVGDSTSGLVKDVADLKQADIDLDERVDALETTVGSATSGLVKDTADLKTTVGDAESGLVKDVADLKAASSTHVTAALAKAAVREDLATEGTEETPTAKDLVEGIIAASSIDGNKVTGTVANAKAAQTAETASKVAQNLTVKDAEGNVTKTFNGSASVEITAEDLGALTDVGSLTIKVGETEAGCSSDRDEIVEFKGGTNIGLSVDSDSTDTNKKIITINSTAVADRRQISVTGVDDEGNSVTKALSGTSAGILNLLGGENITLKPVIDSEGNLTLQIISSDTTYSADESSLALTGTTFAVKNGGVKTAHLADSSVTDAKIVGMSANKLDPTGVTLVLNGGGAAR